MVVDLVAKTVGRVCLALAGIAVVLSIRFTKKATEYSPLKPNSYECYP